MRRALGEPTVFYSTLTSCIRAPDLQAWIPDSGQQCKWQPCSHPLSRNLGAQDLATPRVLPQIPWGPPGPCLSLPSHITTRSLAAVSSSSLVPGRQLPLLGHQVPAQAAAATAFRRVLSCPWLPCAAQSQASWVSCSSSSRLPGSGLDCVPSSPHCPLPRQHSDRDKLPSCQLY